MPGVPRFCRFGKMETLGLDCGEMWTKGPVRKDAGVIKKAEVMVG